MAVTVDSLLCIFLNDVLGSWLHYFFYCHREKNAQKLISFSTITGT